MNVSHLFNFLCTSLKQGVRWDSNMKWKPAEDNSIDFLIHFATDHGPNNWY